MTRSVGDAQKNKSLRTVVNKLDTIDNVYRNFQMEVLAGEPDFVVEMVRSPVGTFPVVADEAVRFVSV